MPCRDLQLEYWSTSLQQGLLYELKQMARERAASRVSCANRPCSSTFAFLQQTWCLDRRPTAARHAVIAASSDVKFQGVDDSDGAPGSDYTSVFALAAFAAAYFEQITINVPFLLKARYLCSRPQHIALSES